MTDNKQLQQVHEASWKVVDSFRETSQTIADSLVAIQDHNLKFAQNIFLSSMGLLTQQTESMEHLQQQWGQPPYQQSNPSYVPQYVPPQTIVSQVPQQALPAPTAFADSAPGGRLGNPAIMPLAPPRGRVDADLPTSLRNVTPKGTRLGLDRRRIARSRRGPWDSVIARRWPS